ncbi:GNAT family N-acetyltransferase [Priestia koreensis]|uniref:GNAT family N-acetyltransferase n=1 Tax=Priestia koreensis TaxID=284581 RepID=UPI0028F73C1E|nr:GNAT family N-acetyltransferase [Priestia koreensis]
MRISHPALDYFITTNQDWLDRLFICDYLHNTSYWAKGRPYDVIQKSIHNSLSFGLFKGSPSNEKQIGFARLVTDQATFAYLADVFVVEGERGRGLGKWMVEVVLSHPAVSDIKRVMLATNDAHDLYAQFGFTSLQTPEKMMELKRQRP